jgi:hypothetical protein
MNKRVLIISPREDQQGIANVIAGYRINFNNLFNGVDIQIYSRFDEPPEEDQLGHWGTGEILAILNRGIISKYGDVNHNILRASFDEHVKLCNEKGIPYMVYQERPERLKEDASKIAIIDLGWQLNKKEFIEKVRDRLEVAV